MIGACFDFLALVMEIIYRSPKMRAMSNGIDELRHGTSME